jgi:hypothetical protein
MASLLYPDLFRSLESVRWNMEKDVPWDKFEASLLTDDQARTIVAEASERELDRRLRTLVALAEPLLLLIMAALVGTIVVGMLLPIFDLWSAIS